MANLSLFITLLKTMSPFDLHAQMFFSSTGKLSPIKSLIFCSLPTYSGFVFKNITNLEIRYWICVLSYTNLHVYYLLSYYICLHVYYLLSYYSYLFVLPLIPLNLTEFIWLIVSTTSLFFSHCWFLLVSDATGILILLLFFASMPSS